MNVAEIVLTQRFTTISKEPETYKIILKTKWKFRFFVFEGSKWADDTECYKATEFWCFVVQRWLRHKITTEDLQSVLGTLKAVTPPRKDSHKRDVGHLILLRPELKKKEENTRSLSHNKENEKDDKKTE